MTGPRTVMHIDMNAFFASVEQQANPALRGKPVAVIGGGGRTVITTASYEARKFGVKTGMAIWEGKRQCPQLIIVIGDNRKYTYTSSRIIEMMKEYTPEVEVFSIDEAWLDVTHSLSIFGTPERIAYLLKSRIKESFGLTCSIGIAPNKLLAKLASDMQKPDGLTVIRPQDVPRILADLPVKELCGIGRKTERHLSLLGICTCGQLGRYPVDILKRKFGVVGERLHCMGLGIDDSPVVPAEEAEEVKSVGHSMTLKRDISSRGEIERYLLQLSEMVGRRARRYGVTGRTVHLTIRYADLSTFGRQETMPGHISHSDDIYRGALQILNGINLEQPVRLLGVRITGLSCQCEQLPLFEDERRKAFMVGAMDRVNNRFGDFTVTFGILLGHDEEKGSHVISPAWKPEGIRNVPVI